MRTLLLLCSVFAVSMAAVIQKRQVKSPWDQPLAEGSLCYPCQDIVQKGESMGVNYTRQWLKTEIATACDNLGGFKQDCNMWFKADFDTIDKAIVDRTPPKAICIRIVFCCP